MRAGRTQRLRLFLDTRYEGIAADARSLVARVFPHNQVGLALGKRGTTTILSVYNLHLACLFPQHGRGIKHKRPIVLEQWQEDAVQAAPWAFLRGCIRSDAAHYQSHRAVRVPVLWVRNYSEDILKIFAHACDLVNVEYRIFATRVRVYRRASVALLRENVGLKS